MEKDLLKSALFSGNWRKNPQFLPFSFEYGGTLTHGFNAEWHPRIRVVTVDSTQRKTILSGCAPDSALYVEFELTEYTDHSVCEWMVRLENRGTENTPVLTRVYAADWEFPFSGKGVPQLWHGIAENHAGSNYSFSTDPLRPETVVPFGPESGRPCDNAFPYFRMFDEAGGFSIAVGWPGRWSASLENRGGTVRLRAGQAATDFYLKPGETFRTPRMTVLSFEGTEEYAVNLWRDWYRAHILPRDASGNPLPPKLCGYARKIDAVEHCSETEQSQIDFIRSARRRGFHFDTWWIDAGWYDCRLPEEEAKRRLPKWESWRPECAVHWHFTGLWECDKARFPRGLKPISDELKKEHADLLLWFEPERINRDANLFQAHPDFSMSVPEAPSRLLNLANRKCVDFLIKYMNAFLRENGIGVYRQDFNIDPLPFWTKYDDQQGAHRSGVTENLYIQGYLTYWDALLAENPGLWIDSCSSGGRRNDLETMRRSVPLHYSDYGYQIYDEKQRYHHVLYEWLMYFKDAPSFCVAEGVRSLDLFHAMTSFAPMYLQHLCLPSDYDAANDFKAIALWREMAPFLISGDYYLLSPEKKFGKEYWNVFQFHDPEKDQGVIQFIRNELAPQENIRVFPRGISADSVYLFRDLAKENEAERIPGALLLKNGFFCALDRTSSTLIAYRKE